MLAIIYTILLGLLCACFVECGIHAFYPGPNSSEWYDPAAPTESPVEQFKQDQRREVYRRKSERHSIGHYLVSLAASTIQVGVALQYSRSLGVLADGILLGAVLTLGTGTVFGVSGGGRIAKFAVATVSLAATLALGGIQFLPHSA
jgi:hypothetical protein